MPQWQGGDEPAYRFGSELLRWLAPPHDGPEESVEVPEADGNPPPVDHGIKWRDALLSQARAAREAIERHAPDRIVTSEERRGGQGCGSTCRTRWSPYN